MTAQVLFSLTKDSMAEWLVLQMQGLSFLNQDSRDDRRSDICRLPANLHCACKCREEWHRPNGARLLGFLSIISFVF